MAATEGSGGATSVVATVTTDPVSVPVPVVDAAVIEGPHVPTLECPANALPRVWGVDISNHGAWLTLKALGPQQVCLPWGILSRIHDSLHHLAEDIEAVLFVGQCGPHVVLTVDAVRDPHHVHTMNIVLVTPPSPAEVENSLLRTQKLYSQLLYAAEFDTYNTIVHAAFLRRRHGDAFVLPRHTCIPPVVAAALDEVCTLDMLLEHLSVVAEAHGVQHPRAFLDRFHLQTKSKLITYLLQVIARLQYLKDDIDHGVSALWQDEAMDGGPHRSGSADDGAGAGAGAASLHTLLGEGCTAYTTAEDRDIDTAFVAMLERDMAMLPSP